MAKVCPMCGNDIVGFPALSRNNRDEICSQCGSMEAVADMRRYEGIPRHCYHDIGGATVLILRGGSGYYPLSSRYTKVPADELNERWGVSKATARRMAGYSMFGWPKGNQVSMNRKSADPGGDAKPAPAFVGPYQDTTLWGHQILAAYYNWMSETFDVIAFRKDVGPGLIFARGYNPVTGMWGGADYDLTREQAEGKAFGREVWSSGSLDRYNWPGNAKRASTNRAPKRGSTASGSKPKSKTTKKKVSGKAKTNAATKKPGNKTPSKTAKKPKTTSTKPRSTASKASAKGRC